MKDGPEFVRMLFWEPGREGILALPSKGVPIKVNFLKEITKGLASEERKFLELRNSRGPL